VCLILFALRRHPDFPLVLAANRDEFYDRPTAPMAFWDDDPALLAGRDLRAGGTWMGLRMDGRFAALTNIRDLRRPAPQEAPSRGHLVLDALAAEEPSRFAEQLVPSAYAGFNLLAGRLDAQRGAEIVALHNHAPSRPAAVEAGVRGLSNATLDVPWPKVASGRRDLGAALADARAGDESAFARRLFDLLSDDARAPDGELPDTGVPLEWERQLSSRFIATGGYGTRSQTALLVRSDGRVFVAERTVAPGGEPRPESSRTFSFDLPESQTDL
jgi:uncharacterized protein with NRDE domain